MGLFDFIFGRKKESTSTYYPPVEEYQPAHQHEEPTTHPIKKATIEEIIIDARQRVADNEYPDIKHLHEKDFIEIAKALSITNLNRWFKYHKFEKDFRFPTNSYVFIKNKVEGFVWFSDEEYNQRKSQGKSVNYVRKEDLVYENFLDVFFHPGKEYSEIIDSIESSITSYKGITKTALKLEMFNIAYDAIRKGNIPEDEVRRLKSIKIKQTKEFNAGGVTHEFVNLAVLHEYVAKFSIARPGYR